MDTDKERLTEKLCEQYTDLIRHMKIMGVNENDIEDLTGEIMVEAFKSLDKLREEDKLVPWLRKIAERRVSKYFRRRSNRKEISGLIKTEAGEIDIVDTIADEQSVEAILQKAEEKEQVDLLINSLPEISRRILRMRFWGEYRHSDIAEILNIKLNTEMSIYRRSLERLRKN